MDKQGETFTTSSHVRREAGLHTTAPRSAGAGKNERANDCKTTPLGGNVVGSKVFRSVGKKTRAIPRRDERGGKSIKRRLTMR